ncbi:nucleolar protein 12 [Fusarium oxysporum f. sp. pisi HDV247]|uniref:Nucleolar protein 12 n=2 Tax=Fusarium oxysporum f. sp. pisi HDV247 TaxID=1080344 RepID=W9Q533_FUSOX|nr:nucleolar protein 12 [Fusarium oxysporum f. sp. pisi HDV247]
MSFSVAGQKECTRVDNFSNSAQTVLNLTQWQNGKLPILDTFTDEDLTKNSSKGLTASSKAVDPTLDALFASSAGPVQAPAKSRYSTLMEQKVREPPKPRVQLEEQDADDEVLSEISEELSFEEDGPSDEEEDGSDASEPEGESEDEQEQEEESSDEPMKDAPVELDDIIDATQDKSNKDRKRKRKNENDDLEGRYLDKLVAEEEAERAGKRQKNDALNKTEKAVAEDEDAGNDSDIPVHETLAKDSKSSDLEKAARTVFLANVSTEAINSKAAKKTLMAHLSSILDKDATPPQAIESLRFRSVAFAGGSLPKRAAYITKSLMDATTKSANAYVVYSTSAAARKAAAELNGTQVLERHLRVDSVAHPSPTDHRRCVFVGNLGFVDDETVLNTNADGDTTEKKKNKTPSDVEEGLWRTFSTQGKVENVRVVRDSKTRVGKGFAYVQFYDGNDVEAALLLDGKKFPPMLPRKLRVTRAKDPRKTALAQERARGKNVVPNGAAKSTKYKHKATPEEQSMAGRTSKLLGRSAAVQQRHKKRPSTQGASEDAQNIPSNIKGPEQFVFEGRRASAKDGTPKDLKLGKKGKGKGRSSRPQNRGARRAAEWKKKS